MSIPTPAIRKGKRARPRKTLFYGPEGIGKSTWAAGCPGVIFLPTENGVDDLDCESFEPTANYADSMANLGWLITADHEFKAVAVDSVDWLLRQAAAYLCQQQGVTSVENLRDAKGESGFGKGFKFLAEFWESKVIKTFDCLNAKGIGVILIAHAFIKSYADPRSAPYDRFYPALQENNNPQYSIGNMMREWADDVLFANYRVYTETHKEGFNRERTNAVGNGERIIYTTEKPTHLAKNRLGMPDEIPLSWEAYASYWPKA
jgi:hypothetical protein